MKTHIQKWGNSLAVRIPRLMAVEINVRAGSEADISLIKGKLIVSSIPERKMSLKSLISKITRDNRHCEIETGSAVGKEIW